MQPLPEVRAAAGRLTALTGELDVLQGLAVLSDVASTLVPSCVGVSITVVVDDEPFTVAATSEDITALDAVQYLGGGPCVRAADEGTPIDVEDVLDEGRWQLYGMAASTRGVASSLSLPLGATGRLPGAMNIYASLPHAFVGKEQMLAEVFGLPAHSYVTNADLSFLTRDLARQLPERLEDKARVDRAVELLSAQRGEAVEQARARLTAAAHRAGASLPLVAELVLVLDQP